MTKYIAVEWPEYQAYMEHPRFREDCYYNSDNNIYFIPEDMYESVFYTELPKEYREKYDIFFNRIKRGQNVLVILYDTEEYKVTKSGANWYANDSFPIILEDKNLLDGINCEVIAVEKIQD